MTNKEKKSIANRKYYEKNKDRLAAEDRLEDEEERDHEAGRDMSTADRRELRQIDLAKTLDKFN